MVSRGYLPLDGHPNHGILIAGNLEHHPSKPITKHCPQIICFLIGGFVSLKKMHYVVGILPNEQTIIDSKILEA